MDPVIFGEHDEKTVKQLYRCIEQEEGSRGVLCADGHLGYSAPIGGVIGYREHVSPAAVGYDNPPRRGYGRAGYPRPVPRTDP